MNEFTKELSQLTPEDFSRLEKLDRIRDRFLSMHRDEVHDACMKDARLTNLLHDKVEAMNQHKMLSVSIITRQYTARADELINRELIRYIKQAISDGTIITYLDEGDQDKFAEYLMRMQLLLDALDSVFVDHKAFLDSIGLVGTKFSLTTEVEAARKSILKWSKDHIKALREFDIPAVHEDADRIYDKVTQQAPVTIRKALRFMNKNKELWADTNSLI